MAYATLAELANHLAPDPLPPGAGRVVERASRDVDSALECAVYDVDATGNPTDPVVVAALRDATLEQVSWRLANGENEGISGAGYSSVSIGGVSLTRAHGGGGAPGSVGRLGEQARQILRTAQLLGTEPGVW